MTAPGFTSISRIRFKSEIHRRAESSEDRAAIRSSGSRNRRRRLRLTLWEAVTPPRVQTLAAPSLPYQNGPFDAYIGMSRHAASDVVGALSSFVNGNNPTAATNTLLLDPLHRDNRLEPIRWQTLDVISSRRCRPYRFFDFASCQKNLSRALQAQLIQNQTLRNRSYAFIKETRAATVTPRVGLASRFGTSMEEIWNISLGYNSWAWALNRQGVAPHLQVHTHDGPIIRIFLMTETNPNAIQCKN